MEPPAPRHRAPASGSRFPAGSPAPPVATCTPSPAKAGVGSSCGFPRPDCGPAGYVALRAGRGVVLAAQPRVRGETMAITENRTATTGDDAAAIDELHEIVDRQRAAFLRDPFPTLEQRHAALGALAGMMMSNRGQIQEALSSDFGVHPALATDLIEVLGPVGRAVYAAENVESWMAPEPRHADPALFGSGRAFVQPQPKGVVGNIVPWNFPFDLSVGPLIEMLAAGNRVVIKPSEYTPACAELLREMIRSTFDRDRVDVVVGGLELARAFTR